MVIADTRLGMWTQVLGPPAVAHKAADKTMRITDSVFIGTSDTDCEELDVMNNMNFHLGKIIPPIYIFGWHRSPLRSGFVSESVSE